VAVAVVVDFAEDHKPKRLQGDFVFCWDQEVDNGCLEVSMSISLSAGGREQCGGDAVMPSAL